METLIKKMRLRNGLTQTQLAKMVGVKQPTIRVD
ncbi:helix-turn-helix transcriptional regulator [Spiroplasma endosymbiont of Clivina fossor]